MESSAARLVALAGLVLAACGAPPPPLATVAIEAPRASPPGPPSRPSTCDQAAVQRARVKSLLSAGRLDRALRVIASADGLCPDSARESAGDRAAAEAELARDPGMSAEAMLQAGIEAEKARRQADAQRLYDRALRAVERASSARVRPDTPNGVPGDIHAVAWGGTGKDAYVVVGHANGASVHDPESGHLRIGLGGRRNVASVAASPDGRTVLEGSLDGARLWAVETARELLHVDGSYELVGWGANGEGFVLGSFERRISLWRAASLTETRTFDVAAKPVAGKEPYLLAVALSPRGDVVAAGLSFGTVKLLRASDGKELRTIAAHGSDLRAVAWSPDGKMLATSCKDEARIWQAASGKLLRTIATGYDGQVAWHPRGNVVAVGTLRGLVQVNAVTGKEIGRIPDAPSALVSFDAEGSRLISADAHRFVVLDAASGAERSRLEKHTEAVQAALFSQSGDAFVLGSWDGTLRVWDADKAAPRRTIKDEDSVLTVAMSPDGRTLASGTTEQAGTLWDAVTGAKLHVVPDGKGWDNAAVFSPDGKLLALGVDDHVAVWDVATSTVVRTLGPLADEVTSLAWSPDGALLAVGIRGNKIHLFSVDSGAETAQEDVDNSVSALGFSPDGARLYAAENDLVAFTVEDGTLKDRRELPGKEGYASALALRRDGALCAVGYSTGVVGFWELPAGNLIRKVPVHTDIVRALAFRPDGKWVLTGSEDGSSTLLSVDGARSVALRMVQGTEDAYAFTPGPEGRVELFGEAGQRYLLCRAGRATYPFELCRERYEAKGLVAAVLAGDDSYLQP